MIFLKINNSVLELNFKEYKKRMNTLDIYIL